VALAAKTAGSQFGNRDLLNLTLRRLP